MGARPDSPRGPRAGPALRAHLVPAGLREAEDRAREEERRARTRYLQAKADGDLAPLREARKQFLAARDATAAILERIQRTTNAAAALGYAEPAPLAQVQSLLRAEDRMVLYATTPDQVVALVVAPDAARIADLGAKEPLDLAVDGLLSPDELLIGPEAIAAARKALIAPLELGPGVRRVLVSPVGRIGFLPLHVLLPDIEVAYLPSGSIYANLRSSRRLRGSDVLALGDPSYRAAIHQRGLEVHRSSSRRELAPLPATRAEVRAVGDVVLLDARATEVGLREALGRREQWRSVHLACHGLIDPERPMLSSLALTADAEDDGLLTVHEVFRMHIPSDLVVLSACETGRGRVFHSEGIVGLVRAFMVAGAPRVICSLWKVDDEATQALMVRFYELWNPKEGEGLGAAAALKKAQEHVRGHEKWKRPHYWAAWVLWGLPQ